MDFHQSTGYFSHLCEGLGLDPPKYLPAEGAEDLTSSALVKLAAGPRTLGEIRHLFGHWLCDLHARGDEALQDQVADIIGALVAKAERTCT